MARRTKRRSRSRRQRGGNAEVMETPEPMVGGEGEGVAPAQVQGGGAKRKKGRKSKRKSRKGKRKTKKKSRKKRKLNKFFALMLAAKKKGLKSFKYNGKTYKGKKHNRLGMIYKRA